MSLSQPQATPAPGQAPPGTLPAQSGQQPQPQTNVPVPTTQSRPPVKATRTGRVWVAVCAATLITIALIIFMVQNTHEVQVSFLGMTGSTSLALMLLIAAVGGILVTVIIGSARIIQLRHAVRRRRS